jgi:hypothetical protein
MNKERMDKDKERRKELAALNFTEKVKLLEKLRNRSLAFAAARKQLAEKKSTYR